MNRENIPTRCDSSVSPYKGNHPGTAASGSACTKPYGKPWQSVQLPAFRLSGPHIMEAERLNAIAYHLTDLQSRAVELRRYL
jgi:hypothetical protein